MADHAGDFGVDEFLGGSRALLRICAVVLRHQLELYRLAVELHALGIQLLDSHPGAELVVLAEVGDGTGQGCDVPDLDDSLGGRGACRDRKQGADREPDDVFLESH